ncbi:MAG: hypothetical protein QOD94_272 [Alphaproteobacteria bacterium]|jgi:hypothetical protein|nr:hypothetical protein [Alphaproteobacteria bacterium]
MEDDAVEIMVRAAISDAFRQRGLGPQAELSFECGEQSYEFMGINLMQSMRAAVRALKTEGWMLERVDNSAPDGANSSLSMSPPPS